MPCQRCVQAAPQAPRAPWEGSGDSEPPAPPRSAGSLIQRPKATSLNDLDEGHSAPPPYTPSSLLCRMGTVLGKNQISNGWVCSRSPPQAASAFRVRGTHFISCSFEDAIRRVEVLGLPCLMQHWGDKEVGVRIWVSRQGFGSCLLNRVL